MLLSSLLIVVATTAVAAPAEGPLTWNWDDAGTVRFRSETLIETPERIRFLARKNLDAAMTRIEASIDYACEADTSRKNTELVCTIERAELGGQAIANDQAKVRPILDEYEEILTGGARVELIIRPDGHFRTFDIEGFETRINRDRVIEEHLRQLLKKALSPLGMQTPKGGADPDREWRHKGMPYFYELMDATGTSGGMRYSYNVVGQEGDLVAIEAHGKAAVASSMEREADLSYSMALAAGGRYRFDTSLGRLVYGEVTVMGKTSTSHAGMGTVQGYTLASRVMQINEDGSVITIEDDAPQDEAKHEAKTTQGAK